MNPRPFRFGAVAALAPTAQAWQELARRAEDLGYSTLLAPDTMATLEPFTALAAAAAATATLRVGTFVLPAPFYTPFEIAWRTLALDLLSGGRLELGLGAGRPAAETEVVHRERPFGSPAERIKQLSDTIHIVKEEVSAAADGHSLLKPVQRPHPRSWSPPAAAGCSSSPPPRPTSSPSAWTRPPRRRAWPRRSPS
ncbi:LLM class flavin-dependent oxidoreductase [Catenulispora yoronensis]